MIAKMLPVPLQIPLFLRIFFFVQRPTRSLADQLALQQKPRATNNSGEISGTRFY